MSTVLRRPKGAPRKQRAEDPDITAVLDQISVLTPTEREFKGIIKQLLAQEQLELTGQIDLDQLCIRLVSALGDLLTADAKARLLSEWLLDLDEVEDLYLDDEELARVIAGR